MKKAVFVAWVLSFCSADLRGMPSDRKENRGTPLLGERKDVLVANPSARSEKKVVSSPAKPRGGDDHKRELSQSVEKESEVQKRCRKEEGASDKRATDLRGEEVFDEQTSASREDDSSDKQITDAQKLDGFRKRIEKQEKEKESLRQKLKEREKENKSLDQEIKERKEDILILEQRKEEQEKEIKEKEGQIHSLVQQNAGLSQSISEKEAVVKVVDEYLNLSREECERNEIVKQISAELWRRCGTNVVEKAKILIPAFISEVLKLREENIKNKAEITGLQRENIENKAEIEKLWQKYSESEAAMTKLQEQISQVTQGGPHNQGSSRVEQVLPIQPILQDQVNRDERIEMDVDQGGNNAVSSGGINNFYRQAPMFHSAVGNNFYGRQLTFNNYSAAASSSRNTVMQNNEMQAAMFGSKNEFVTGNVETIKNGRLGTVFKGRFVGGYLDLSKPFSFKGCYVKEQEFVLSGPSSDKLKISKEDFSNIDEARAIGGRLSIFSSKTKNGIISGKNFVYKGVVDSAGRPNGLGIVLKSTGEVIEERFSANGNWEEILK